MIQKNTKNTNIAICAAAYNVLTVTKNKKTNLGLSCSLNSLASEAIINYFNNKLKGAKK